MSSSLLLHNATIVTGSGERKGSVSVAGERISNVWYPDERQTVVFGDNEIPYGTLPELFLAENKDAEVHDLTGKLLFAGGIDAHVHFREPGLTEKADMATESRAAVSGGVTSFIDMPNTNPPTISEERLDAKLDAAEGRAFANFGFHIGATNSNFDEIKRLTDTRPQDFGGIKVFMGSSTGNMLVDSESALEKFFSTRQKEVLVHCEDESIIRQNISDAQEKYGEDIPFDAHMEIRSRKACIRSSIRALELAMKYRTRLHLLHLSTAEEVEMVRAARQTNPDITAETSINYLWFCNEDYTNYGSRVKCNPSIKTASDRSMLRKALKDGIIDTVGTDHAPHLPEEKARKYMTAPSGMPSIQHTLSVLLTIARQDEIPLERIASVFSEKAASLFGIRDRGFIREGYFADIVIVDPEKEFTVNHEDILYKCGWSPYEGSRLKGWVETVFVNGEKAVENGAMCMSSPAGKKLIFK